MFPLAEGRWTQPPPRYRDKEPKKMRFKRKKEEVPMPGAPELESAPLPRLPEDVSHETVWDYIHDLRNPQQEWEDPQTALEEEYGVDQDNTEELTQEQDDIKFEAEHIHDVEDESKDCWIFQEFIWSEFTGSLDVLCSTLQMITAQSPSNFLMFIGSPTQIYTRQKKMLLTIAGGTLKGPSRRSSAQHW